MNSINKTDFFDRLKEESNIYKNYSFIYEKAETDGYLELMFEMLQKIFGKEIDFAVQR